MKLNMRLTPWPHRSSTCVSEHHVQLMNSQLTESWGYPCVNRCQTLECHWSVRSGGKPFSELFTQNKEVHVRKCSLQGWWLKEGTAALRLQWGWGPSREGMAKAHLEWKEEYEHPVFQTEQEQSCPGWEWKQMTLGRMENLYFGFEILRNRITGHLIQ